MSFKTHARHGSATMPHGITAERSRVDLNAFVIVCFVWRAPRPELSDFSGKLLPEPKPGALARAP